MNKVSFEKDSNNNIHKNLKPTELDQQTKISQNSSLDLNENVIELSSRKKKIFSEIQIEKNVQNFKEEKVRGQSAAQFIDEVQRGTAGTMGQMELYEKIDTKIQILQQRNNELRKSITQNYKMPYLLCGVNRSCFEQSYAYLPDRVMDYYRIQQTTVTDFLLKVYKASLYAMVDKNQSFMKEYWEEGFRQETLTALDSLPHKLQINHRSQFLEGVQERCKIVDAVMVRGVSAQRNKNEHPKTYHRFEEDKQVGLITYTPLRLTSNNEHFMDPEKNKHVYEGYQQMVMRILLLVRSPLRLSFAPVQIPSELNTYQHVVLFQNSMEAPPPLESSYKYQTLLQWLGKYRFGTWRIADIDNFMLGNSLFRKHCPPVPLDPIFKGTSLDKSYFANIRDV